MEQAYARIYANRTPGPGLGDTVNAGAFRAFCHGGSKRRLYQRQKRPGLRPVFSDRAQRGRSPVHPGGSGRHSKRRCADSRQRVRGLHRRLPAYHLRHLRRHGNGLRSGGPGVRLSHHHQPFRRDDGGFQREPGLQRGQLRGGREKRRYGLHLPQRPFQAGNLQRLQY